MLNLRQLANKTTDLRKINSRYVKIKGRPKTGYDSEGHAYIAAQTYSTHVVTEKGVVLRNPSPSKYVTMITFVNKKLDCKVSCSCADNMFRWEVANWYKNASEIEYSNGERPRITNPRLNPGLCKHLFYLFLKIQHKLP